MSVTAIKDKGVTVITIKSNSKSMFPPLCQILGALCYCPVCCSVQRGLMNPCVTAVIGTIQIMMGLFNIALGPGRPWIYPWYFADLGGPYWQGAVYAASGITSILAGRFPFTRLNLLTKSDIASVIMAVLQMCLCTGFAVLAIKALVSWKKEEVVEDVEDQQPEMKEILLTSPCA